MDSPGRPRPLAGVDQALGEGRARQPTELLDQLRERLTRLDPSHPSASPRPADSTAGVADDECGNDELSAAGAATADREADPATAPADLTGPDESRAADRPASDASRESSDRRNAGRPDSERARDESSGRPADAGPSGATSSQDAVTADGGPASAAPELGPGWHRDPGIGDPYRPWFAGDDSLTPWFAE